MLGDKSEIDTDDAIREQGIEFGHLYQALKDHSYPATRDELIASRFSEPGQVAVTMSQLIGFLTLCNGHEHE